MKLTIDACETRHVMVEEWTSRAVLRHILQVADQIFFACWTEEEVRQAEDSINAQTLSMGGHFVDIGHAGATDFDHAEQLVLAARLEPFLQQADAFVQFQGATFANGVVDNDALDVLLLQQRGVLVDHIIVDGALPEIWKHFAIRSLFGAVEHWLPQIHKITYLSSLNGVNTGHNKPLKLN